MNSCVATLIFAELSQVSYLPTVPTLVGQYQFHLLCPAVPLSYTLGPVSWKHWAPPTTHPITIGNFVQNGDWQLSPVLCENPTFWECLTLFKLITSWHICYNATCVVQLPCTLTFSLIVESYNNLLWSHILGQTPDVSPIILDHLHRCTGWTSFTRLSYEVYCGGIKLHLLVAKNAIFCSVI